MLDNTFPPGLLFLLSFGVAFAEIGLGWRPTPSGAAGRSGLLKGAIIPRKRLFDNPINLGVGYESLNIPWRSAGVSATAYKLLTQYKPENHKLLEIGCGTGEDAPSLVELGFEYLGLDISEAAIRQAASLHGSTV
jgi:hypothetical protein